MLKDIESPPLVFVFGKILCAALEYFTSFAMEKAFHARWRDYSGKRFNIRGRVCLENVAVFGALCLFLDRALRPLVSSIAARERGGGYGFSAPRKKSPDKDSRRK